MEKKLQKNISYTLQFVDCIKCMASSLSNLDNNLSKGIHKIKCKYEYGDKKCETCLITYEGCNLIECLMTI